MSLPFSTDRLLVYYFLSIPILFWLLRVNKEVPEPYLDEVFHVGQAQTYWKGEWTQWDPKITTPLALYVFSWLLNRLCAFFSKDGGNFGSKVENLRGGNAVLLIFFIPRILLLIRDSLWKDAGMKNRSSCAAHTVVNICLFPVVFFFSGLYYTDLLSVLLVLETYHLFQLRAGSSGSFIHSILVFVVGLASLTARQTNIFWVAIFLGGLEVVNALPSRSLRIGDDAVPVLKAAWAEGVFHDVDIETASTEDVLFFTISLITATVKSMPKVLTTLVPYLALLGSFGVFVLWNGGVVLGDKENHVASIHIPQMLYIWPYFVFFSWPLLIPHALNAGVPTRYLPRFLRYRTIRDQLPRPGVTAGFLVGMALAVRFNTIIHPFTLADNRHYVFYVFRLLGRTPWTKLLVVPVYFVCAWLAIMAFGELKGTGTDAPNQKNPAPAAPRKQDGLQGKGAIAEEGRSIKLSFVLVWLIATTLSLITAPLVEPRYFLVPWILWRVHLPSISANSANDRDSSARATSEQERSWLLHDWRLYLETMWYLLVSVATGYLFLYRGFEWPQEPGRVQRFMW